MKKILEEIKQADAASLDSILKAVLCRYAELFPSWEIAAVSFEKRADRNEQLCQMIETLEKMKQA